MKKSILILLAVFLVATLAFAEKEMTKIKMNQETVGHLEMVELKANEKLDIVVNGKSIIFVTTGEKQTGEFTVSVTGYIKDNAK